LFIVFLGIVLYFPFLGSVHLFDWDEINFAESAREMLVSGNYLDVQINFETFWEKPPLFIWLQVLSMQVFGINEFAARFPNALVGIATLLVLFAVGKKLLNEKFGWIWVFTHSISILPFLYFKSGIIDPLFNLFIFAGIYQFVLFSKALSKKWLHLILAAFFIGLGILTKGPVSLLLFLLTAFFYMVLKKKYLVYLHWKVLSLSMAVLTLVGGFWFILQYFNGNAQILSDFIVYQIRLFQTKDAGHGGFLLYHFVVVFIGVFPASILALKGYRKPKESSSLIADFHLWMQILLWVVLVLFTIVSTKIVHYSSMAYFPVTFFGSYFIYQWLDGKIEFSKWLKIMLFAVAILWSLGIIILTFIGLNTQKIIASGIIKDEFANANLGAKVHWSGFEMYIGILFLILLSISLFWIKSKKKSIYLMFAATLFFTYFSTIVIVPKIEAYSQRAAIEFYQKLAHQDVYVIPYGFKSYAHYYYSEIPLPTQVQHADNQWLLSGDTDKPVYVVVKNISAIEFSTAFPHFVKLYEKNGFVFFKKKD